MNSLLYESAVQVVPLLLIALFLDRRIESDDTTAEARRWSRWSNKFSLLLNAIAFMVSVFVLAGVMPVSSLSMAIVISAVAGSIGVLFAQVWQRLDDEPHRPRS
ncbi:hypothetical protein [Arthrobacter sp. Helios]|uniref:hypothetical protein n=1 Tax=Arthrobacter sp. Helios TaxID=2828862 RepID=UPI0020484C4A|nr:hypothetical protein [Arthrobacter sp. Helios]UPO78443.1 hypothetical protein ArtHe_07175 [Arthrobacter sp. Helios]